MTYSERKANEKAGVAAIALTMLTLLILAAGAVYPLQAQTDSPTKAEPEVNHNTWTTGTAMPTARMGAAAGAIGKNIYVIGGYYVNDIIGVNEIYNPKTNKWTTGTSDPHPRAFVAYAVVNKILYVIGGSDGSEILSLTESYNPATDTWTTLAPMPYAVQTASAVADKDIIYVIGGQDNGFFANVASYNTTTNTWTEEAPLLVDKGWSAVGLLGTTIVSAGGSNGSARIGDNEGYSVKKNTWAELPADPTPRTVGCYAAIKGQLYVAGGLDANGNSLTLNEAYNPKTKSWTTLDSLPLATDDGAGSAESGGRLYCFGGGTFDQIVYNNVQIYQP